MWGQKDLKEVPYAHQGCINMIKKDINIFETLSLILFDLICNVNSQAEIVCIYVHLEIISELCVIVFTVSHISWFWSFFHPVCSIEAVCDSIECIIQIWPLFFFTFRPHN